MDDVISGKTVSCEAGAAIADTVGHDISRQSNIGLRASSTQTIMEKLSILTDAAKYDVACTSSGVDRKGNGRDMGNCVSAGICHSFSADGRCISLLKILMSNE